MTPSAKGLRLHIRITVVVLFDDFISPYVLV